MDQSDIWIPKCTEGGGGVTDLGNFLKFYWFLLSASFSQTDRALFLRLKDFISANVQAVEKFANFDVHTPIDRPILLNDGNQMVMDAWIASNVW